MIHADLLLSLDR